MTELSFEWDQANIRKNAERHGVSPLEAESVFFDSTLLVYDDLKHSEPETRWIAYGTSSYHRVMMIAFTIRSGKIRVISTRQASRKERALYEEKKH